MAHRVSARVFTFVALSLLLASSVSVTRTKNHGNHLTGDDTILDLLNHPAFAGFGRLLLPWDDRSYDNGMRLRNVGSLLAGGALRRGERRPRA